MATRCRPCSLAAPTAAAHKGAGMCSPSFAPRAPLLQLLPDPLQAAACDARLLNLPRVFHHPLHPLQWQRKLPRLRIQFMQTCRKDTQHVRAVLRCAAKRLRADNPADAAIGMWSWGRAPLGRVAHSAYLGTPRRRLYCQISGFLTPN